MYSFEEPKAAESVMPVMTAQIPVEQGTPAEVPSEPAAEPPKKKKVVKKKIVRRVVKKPQENAPLNILKQDKVLNNIASEYAMPQYTPVEINPVQSEGMPDLVMENYHELAQANVPVSSEEPDISDIVFDEADSRYNFDDFSEWGEDGDGDGDDDGGGSGFVIEI